MLILRHVSPALSIGLDSLSSKDKDLVENTIGVIDGINARRAFGGTAYGSIGAIVVLIGAVVFPLIVRLTIAPSVYLTIMILVALTVGLATKLQVDRILYRRTLADLDILTRIMSESMPCVELLDAYCRVHKDFMPVKDRTVLQPDTV